MATRRIRMSEQTWTVTGMTCQHCVASVTEEVGDLPDVDLASGALTVRSDAPVAVAAVRAAVEEAGYQLAG
jgi:copper chaperone